MTNHELVAYAKTAAIDFAPSGSCSAGTVGAALLSSDDQVFTGLCIDLPCGMGFCAEHAAAAEMLKHRQSRIVKMVAVASDGKLRPPCGRCREFMMQINPENRHTEVLLSGKRSVTLESMLPHSYLNESD